MKPITLVRLWSLQNVFLLWLVWPKIVELNENRCVVRIPLNWITRRRDIHASARSAWARTWPRA
jgi:hypothetical protein